MSSLLKRKKQNDITKSTPLLQPEKFGLDPTSNKKLDSMPIRINNEERRKLMALKLLMKESSLSAVIRQSITTYLETLDEEEQKMFEVIFRSI